MDKTRHRVADTADLAEDGSRVIAEVAGNEIAVFRLDGEFYALSNYCVHQAGPLCEGAVTGKWTIDDDGWGWQYDESEKCVMCPWHGWTFDIDTGTNIADSRYSVPSYEVEVDGEGVFVIFE